jgi:hypothetical protein
LKNKQSLSFETEELKQQYNSRKDNLLTNQPIRSKNTIIQKWQLLKRLIYFRTNKNENKPAKAPKTIKMIGNISRIERS